VPPTGKTFAHELGHLDEIRRGAGGVWLEAAAAGPEGGWRATPGSIVGGRPASSTTMTHAPAILLIDSSAGDRTLAKLLLERELPDAKVIMAADALAVANALEMGVPDVAIVAADLAWAKIDHLIAGLKRRAPGTAIVLFGHELDIASRALDPGLACEGLVRKNSTGFLALATIITEVLARRNGVAPAPSTITPAAKSASSGPGDNDLREIALVFSHDFREPVQQIARLARRGQAAQTTDGAAQTLRQVLECAERAGSMLDGMIEYLAVTEAAARLAPVDLNACLDQAVDNLSAAISEAQAEIRFGRLPVVVGDEHQLVHLFQNLVSNAIKFRGRERPVVTIGCEPNGDYWQLAFRDNGMGIPEEFTERIFDLGRRLHTREEYPGSGIGLALCKRIVERHGGRIWSESREGEGSTFYVLLPRHADNAALPS
jgi:signal transduction histidine kinase